MTTKAWYRIHLSTAILLVFVAGALLWANLRPHDFYSNEIVTEASGNFLTGGKVTKVLGISQGVAYGWPMDVMQIHGQVDYWRGLPILVNAVVAGATLFIVGAPWEHFIRRRARNPRLKAQSP